MRGSTGAFLLTLLVASPLAARNLGPLIVNGEEATVSPMPPLIDRASAREVARIRHVVHPVRDLGRLRAEGSVETLREPIRVRIDAANGTAVARIVVEGASSLRLRFEGTRPGAVLWVAGGGDEAFERFETSAGPSWGPTTRGDSVYVMGDGGPVDVSIAQLVAGNERPAGDATSCALDVACSDAGAEAEQAGRAIAMLRFVRGDASYVCTGALLSDAAGTRTPYMLTAHHCIASDEEAASIEAVWDDRSPSCGTAPAGTIRRTYGARLLVSSAATDVALLQLDRLPPNRVFLGVELDPLAEGTPTYRLSHGDGAPQRFSAGVVRGAGAGCMTAPRPSFVYTAPTAGAVSKGSSGAPLLLSGLRVAGQLLGLCGPSPDDACATYNDAVDGSIAASWPLLAPYLDPPRVVRGRSVRH